MKEKLRMLLEAMIPILSDAKVPLDQKIATIARNYTKLLLENEELPIFILNEWSVNKEFQEPLKEKGITTNTADFIVNILGLVMFPFVAKPMITSSGLVKEEEFADFVKRREGNIVEWINKINA